MNHYLMFQKLRIDTQYDHILLCDKNHFHHKSRGQTEHLAFQRLVQQNI
jgi:hypothetical protein